MVLHLTDLEQAYVDAAKRGDQAEADRLEALVQAEHDAKEQAFAAPDALLNAALWYAGTLHWPVFPCAAGDKRPATRHGYKDATTDAEQIREWWTQNPYHNIGLPTGHHFDVFDIDGPEGLIAFGEFIDAGIVYPNLIGLSLTPRGRHYLLPPRGTKNAANPVGIDVRGKGGYIVAPPSRTPTGTYRWSIPPTPERNAA